MRTGRNRDSTETGLDAKKKTDPNIQEDHMKIVS